MRISLIVATVGRTNELKRFISSLNKQTYRDFELIIVDQNEDDRLTEVLCGVQGRYPLHHLRSQKGASRARNLGASYASGTILAFPDDDVWYTPDLLGKIVDFFAAEPKYAGLTGMTVDENNRPTIGRWDLSPGDITRYNVWTRSAEHSLFIRKEVFEALGGFDECLGPGAGTPWGACEGDDLILRSIKQGFRFYYDPHIRVGHPNPVPSYNEEALHRALFYGQGMGYVLRKHGYPLWFSSYFWSRSLGGAFLALARGRLGEARYYWTTFVGRLRGWFRLQSK